jgi:hypothetical protein
MSTRSRIAIKSNDEIKSIYCHWDGYLSNNGKILLKHYSEVEKLEKLISLGDISALDVSPETVEGHSFDNKIHGYTVAYHRDRGEAWANVKPLVHSLKTMTLTQYLKSSENELFSEEYAYLFDVKTKTWKYWKGGTRWYELTEKAVNKK